MATGLKIYNAAGQVSLDTSKSGGVLLDVIGLTITASQATYFYTIPAGSSVRVITLPKDFFEFDPDYTPTVNIVDTTAYISFSVPAGRPNVSIWCILLIV